jgi:signal peptidase I
MKDNKKKEIEAQKLLLRHKIQHSIRATGLSMYPTIMPGWWIFTNPINNTKLQIGEIVVFAQKDELVLHRIVQINANKILTQGDHNHTHDTWLQRDEILARATHADFFGKRTNLHTNLRNKLKAIYLYRSKLLRTTVLKILKIKH